MRWHMDISLKLIIALHRNIDKIDKRTMKLAQKEGLTFGQFEVLEVLYSKGDMSIGNVMEKILSSVGTISVIVNNLVKLDYIERLPCENDKRICILHLKDKGRDVIERVVIKNTEMLEESFSMLTEEEKENLLITLKKIGGIYEERSN
ncbi:MarR family winged helix-turn-helix transcriptional regulator [Peptostreptococcus porci]|uniref:MarR family winged helix-turn-helix transcriptional regulator n=1 Tax=Peptostreptococcus porci TaxID=2652282 RepID=UPI002A840C08|nr:MarR family transcriptional regulator [Peptostreptococcus porci]MDY4129010.1 MarR family transcriptional regulator [Peptostreptococcus porci]